VMPNNVAWESSEHLSTFSDYRKDLKWYRRYRNAKIFHNFGRCIVPALARSKTVGEVGVGGGRTYQFINQLIGDNRLGGMDFRGYDVSKACIDSCNEYFGDMFEVSSSASPRFRKSELIYFFDVLVHSPRPLEFLDGVSSAATKYLCLQTPTRDIGETEFDISKSCRLENGFWIPWIVFNFEELLDELRRRGFEKFLVAKSYKCFALGRHRFVPREFYLPGFPSSRTAILAIKSEGFVKKLLEEVDLETQAVRILRNEMRTIPRWLEHANLCWRRMHK
jgi:hypothetical protein